MKFKPIYFYGILGVIAVIVLIIVATQQSSEPTGFSTNTEQIMPDDDVHKQLQNQGTIPPSKENVSESYKQKLSELKSAVEKNPEDTLVLRKYADFLTASHKMDEAMTYYEKILKVNSRRTDIYFSLALILFNKKEFAKCEEANNKVLSYDPTNQMALYNIGAIAATRGNKEKAKEYWNKVILINAESETGKLAKESLTKL
jgi:tetratricopeptide (TPR) repeat protein